MKIFKCNNGMVFFYKLNIEGESVPFIFTKNKLRIPFRGYESIQVIDATHNIICDTILLGKTAGVPDDSLYLFKAMVEQWDTETTSYNVMNMDNSMMLIRKEPSAPILTLNEEGLSVGYAFGIGDTRIPSQVLQLLSWYYSLLETDNYMFLSSNPSSNLRYTHSSGSFLEHNSKSLPNIKKLIASFTKQSTFNKLKDRILGKIL